MSTTRSVFRFLILSLLLTLFVFTCASAAVDPDDNGRIPDLRTILTEAQQAEKEESTGFLSKNSTLPSSLRIIDESAFEGTALVSVDLPESVEIIGDEAFARIPTLRSVYIPDNTKFIGKNAFAGSDRVTLNASANSHARDWARRNGIPFAPVACVTASGGPSQALGIYRLRTGQNKLSGSETTDPPRYSEQNGRAEGEIKAAKHETCFAYSIQGRSPPIAG